MHVILIIAQLVLRVVIEFARSLTQVITSYRLGPFVYAFQCLTGKFNNNNNAGISLAIRHATQLPKSVAINIGWLGP